MDKIKSPDRNIRGLLSLDYTQYSEFSAINHQPLAQHHQ